MNTMEKIVEEVRTLPETDAREVLDFVGYLKSRRAQINGGNGGHERIRPVRRGVRWQVQA
jgi:hypothetical protein